MSELYRDPSWVDIANRAWHLMSKAERMLGGTIGARVFELLYGPAVAEAQIRKPLHAQALNKLMPNRDDIQANYIAAEGNPSELSILDAIASSDAVAERFAGISGDKFVAVSAALPVRSQAICILAHTLDPIMRQYFLGKFLFWGDRERNARFNDDEIAAWNESELELGMGIVSALWNAKQIVPDLSPEEFASALLRKYGIPINIKGSVVYVCHWCRNAPCACGGDKQSFVVTYEDAAANLSRGPRDTQHAMYYSYSWANIARGGAGYGPFRALVEAATEKGAVLLDANSFSSLERLAGPLLLPQQRHIAEIIGRFGKGPEASRKARNSELADAVHWQFLYAPGVCDHTKGLLAALDRVEEYVGR